MTWKRRVFYIMIAIVLWMPGFIVLGLPNYESINDGYKATLMLYTFLVAFPVSGGLIGSVLCNGKYYPDSIYPDH